MKNKGDIIWPQPRDNFFLSFVWEREWLPDFPPTHSLKASSICLAWGHFNVRCLWEKFSLSLCFWPKPKLLKGRNTWEKESSFYLSFKAGGLMCSLQSVGGCYKLTWLCECLPEIDSHWYYYCDSIRKKKKLGWTRKLFISLCSFTAWVNC